MPNRVTLQATKFKNIPDGKTTQGFRMYDDYNQAYDNTWDAIPEDDGDVLRKVAVESYDEATRAMLAYAKEEGIYINDSWYTAEQVLAMMRSAEIDDEE